jgi:hypothetical protein
MNHIFNGLSAQRTDGDEDAQNQQSKLRHNLFDRPDKLHHFQIVISLQSIKLGITKNS